MPCRSSKGQGSAGWQAELNRHKGQLLLRQGQSEAAEELYRKALSIAEEQEAKLWELRAAASLARLRRDQGRRAEARDLLAPVYGWFTEGFDTADLKEAKALLDELGVSCSVYGDQCRLVLQLPSSALVRGEDSLIQAAPLLRRSFRRQARRGLCKGRETRLRVHQASRGRIADEARATAP